MIKDRLDSYFYEANRHKEHILEAKAELNIPIRDYDNLPKLEKFALNTLIFRFAKLQDLIGVKIFRAYLEYMEFPLSDMSFFDILKAIEKEKIIDIDSWSYLRKLRNDIAHDYPEELQETLEKVNLLIQKSDILIKIVDKLESKYYETKQNRARGFKRGKDDRFNR